MSVNTSQLILLDTSAWLCFFQARGGHPVQVMVKDLLVQQRAATTPPVVLELVTGAQKQDSLKDLLADLEALPNLAVTEETWANASKLACQLHEFLKEPLPLSDILIASVAMQYDCPLLHVDPIFDEIAKHGNLSVQRLPDERLAA